jgi:hypothetical protein
MGPPRRTRCSLRPEDVTHFTFWTKWPRPFFPVLEQVLEVGYPVLWNVTLTGLGATNVEPHVPPPTKSVTALKELSRRVPSSGIVWRYDPILLSARYDRGHHRETFGRLAEALAGSVDRVALSFVTRYRSKVEPDLRAYQRESGDTCGSPCRSEQIDLIGELRELAAAVGLPVTLCCSPEVRGPLGLARTGCNSFDWARRVYPILGRFPRLKDRPSRPDCGCSAEVDIGVYDTCVLGCRYSYASANLSKARRNFELHDPSKPCLIP